MDTKQCIKDLYFLLLFIVIQGGLCNIDDDYEDGPSFGRCPWIRNKLKNGRVRYRYKGRVAKFLCDSGYELAGKRSSTCVRGQWSNPVPVCVARGCSRVPSVPNGRVTEMYRGALLVYDCNPGYALEGETSIHCDGRRWSTAPPACVIATENPETSCDFESADLCGWSHDPQHDFDWKRNQYVTPSGHVGTGPTFDHTFGESKGGFYLYIEASSPRKINDTARLFSPVYSPDFSGGCFTFWYHMYGATTGGLRVYLKPESHVFDELKPNWEKYGEQGNQWLRGNMIVPALHENFQIVIEGIRGESYVGDSAIDDVRLTNSLCDSLDNSTDSTENTAQDSCRGRCQEVGSSSSCGCSDNCFVASNCCTDYFATCGAGNETSVQNADETSVSDYLSKTSSLNEVTAVTMTMGSTEREDNDKTTAALPKSSSKSEETTSVSSVTSSSVISTLSTTLASTTDGSTSTKTSPVSSTVTTSSSTFRPTIQSTKSYSSSSTAGTTSTFAPSTRATTTSSTTAPPVSSTSTSSSTTVIKTTVTSTTLGTTTKSTTINTQTQPTTFAPTTGLSSTDLTSLSSTQSTSSPSTSTSSPTTSTSTSSPTTSTFADSTTISTTGSTSTNPSSSTVTLSTSTRKTYNLRPRTSRSSSVSSTLPTTVSTTQSTSLPFSSTAKSSKEETTTEVKSTSFQSTEWHRYSVYPTVRRATQSTSFTPKTTRPPAIYPVTTSRLATPSTKIINWNKISTPFLGSTTAESYLSDQQKTETATSTSKVPVVISIVIIVVILAVVGIAYYLRKQKNRRQSKLSDDSEMRFLPESEYMEYSDASALDKILTK